MLGEDFTDTPNQVSIRCEASPRKQPFEFPNDPIDLAHDLRDFVNAA